MATFAPQKPPSCVGNLKDAIVVSNFEELAQIAEAKDQLVIGTHDGTFHCDEVLACSMLKMLPAYEKAVIMRTRDEAALSKCKMVVDVGAKYEPEKHRYDHHQREFTDVMQELNFKTKLSSAGLVYRHFGRDFIKLLVGELSAEAVDAIYRKTYKSFMEEIDGIDNGVESFEGGSRNYEVTTTLSGRVAQLNPDWNEGRSNAELNARFACALTVVGAEIASVVSGYAQAWWPARAVVSASLDGAAAVHASGEILVLEQYVPYSTHLYDLEKEKGSAAAKYVLYPEPNGKWRIQAVAVSEGSFTSRLKLPGAWRGLRGDELSEKSGVEGCVFVHAGGFIGGNATREGALQMALKAIAWEER